MSIFNDIAAQHEREVSSGSRFRFGRNWVHFLRRLNDARIIEAENNLNQFLGEGSLADKTFLDIGSGSGLSGSSTSASVPEPAGIVLMTVAATLAGIRRRRRVSAQSAPRRSWDRLRPRPAFHPSSCRDEESARPWPGLNAFESGDSS